MLTLFLLFFCMCGWWCLRKRRLQLLTARVPTSANALPIIGHGHKFIGDGTYFLNFMETLHKETNRVGGLQKLWLGPKLVFVVTDPKLALTLLNEVFGKMYVYKFTSKWLGQGLVTSDVPIWKRHRKIIHPTFNQQLLNGFIGVFNEESSRLVDSLEKEVEKEISLFEPFIKNSLEAICQTAMGIPSNDRMFTQNYIHAIRQIQEIVGKRIRNVWMHLNFVYYWSITKRTEDKVLKVLKKMSLKIIKQTRTESMNRHAEANGKPGRFKSFLNILLEMGDKGLLTDNEISEEVDTMLSAGSDTISGALLFTLILLGTYTEVQDKVYKEIQEVMGTSDRDVTKEDFNLFTYTEAVIKESLRLFPVGALIGREIDKDVVIDDQVFPAGSSIIVPIKGIHTNKCWGDDADSFKPERWLDPSTLPESPASFAAFGIGRRNCIGKTYSMMSVKTTLVHLLRRFRVKADCTKLVTSWDCLLKPVSGHHVILYNR